MFLASEPVFPDGFRVTPPPLTTAVVGGEATPIGIGLPSLKETFFIGGDCF